MKNLDANGNIVTGSTISTLGRVELRDVIFNALNKNEYQFSWTQNSHQPYQGVLCDGSKMIDLYIYVWNITPTYINNNAEQKRIQINANVDNVGFQRGISATQKTLLLGVYNCPGKPIIVSWDCAHYQNHSQNTCYVYIDELKQAFDNGFFSCNHNCQIQVMTSEYFPTYVSALSSGNKLSVVAKKGTSVSKTLKDSVDYIANIKRIEERLSKLSEPERMAYIKQRVGQGEFKKILLAKYGCKCALCGITTQPLLVASHIKPWSKSTNSEKLDPNNGLLLCAHHDALFDKGLLSFADDGKPVFSSLLKEDERVQLRLDEIPNLEVPEEMKPFLLWHRNHLLK